MKACFGTLNNIKVSKLHYHVTMSYVVIKSLV